MKEIKFVELMKEWFVALKDTAIGIWQLIVVIYHQPIAILLLFVGLVALNVVKTIKYEKIIENKEYTIDSLNNTIDSVATQCNYENVVKVKLADVSMHPHKLKTELCDSTVAALLVELNAWFPDIKMAQYHIESAMGTSNVARNSNNLCGMKVTQNRNTTQLKGQSYHGYGVYNNWESCIIDHIMYDYNVFGYKKPTREQYIAYLNKKYSTTNGYGNIANGESKKYRKYFTKS